MFRSTLRRPPQLSIESASYRISTTIVKLQSRSLSHSSKHLTTPRPPKNSVSNASSLNIWAQVRCSPRPIRYLIYTGFALAATAETTFWTNVIYAKWFAGDADREKADALLDRLTEAVRGYRARYLNNYGAYYSAGVWGL